MTDLGRSKDMTDLGRSKETLKIEGLTDLGRSKETLLAGCYSALPSKDRLSQLKFNNYRKLLTGANARRQLTYVYQVQS